MNMKGTPSVPCVTLMGVGVGHSSSRAQLKQRYFGVGKQQATPRAGVSSASSPFKPCLPSSSAFRVAIEWGL